MNILSFPGTTGNTHAVKNQRFRVKRLPPMEARNRFHTGPIEFTCTSCATISRVETSNILFRCLDAYCGGCGQRFRVMNPAFDAKT